MAYIASYRKYRPSTFETVAGQKHIVVTLQNALRENKIAHAYLFCGPRGTGKTSMARLFAKALNCEEGFGHQCNKCPNCEAIIKGAHPDVIEIDAASNRGIDDIRDLISKVKYSPTLGKWKIYIVDEVHMLTVEAFNALLKTLEEPPANVIFILCTTEPYKLMPTILSRVQRYDFTRIGSNDLLNNLKHVCENEHIDYDELALKEIVNLADGGARDSLSLLDQAIAYSGKKIELHHIQELYGLSTIEEKITLLKELSNSNIKYVSEKLDSFISHGTDIKRLTGELIELIKDLIIYKTTKDGTILKTITSLQAEEFDVSRSKLNQILDILMNVYSQYRLVSNINSLLEVAFIKICSLEDTYVESAPQVKVIEKVVEKVVEVPTKVVKEEPKPVKVEPKVEKPTPSLKGVKDFTENGDIFIPSEDDIMNLMLQGNKPDKEALLQSWGKLQNYITDPSIGKYVSLLSQCLPRIVAKNVLVLVADFQNVINKLNLVDNQAGISKTIEAISGSKYVTFVISTKTYNDLIQKYRNLQQAGKLPATYDIDIKIKGSQPVSDDSRSATEQFVEEFK